jgi:pilus assembly protein CpaB
MQGRNLILLIAAVVIGLFAVFLANTYFSGVEQKQQRIAEEQKLQRIVVASQDLAFGVPLSAQNLRLANWPASSVPTGAFTSIEAAMRNGRVALRPIVVGEPVLASKVSGADGRAVLSANLPVGKVAYAIPINATAGVGGFVRPGDVVDVLLTRQIPGAGAGGASAGNDKMTDIVLTAIPVLGIDQNANEKDTKPATGKTATLEVDSYGAQKLALATQLGVLSLALRNVEDQVAAPRSTVIARNLSASNYIIRPQPSGPPPAQMGAAVASAIMRPAASLAPPRPRGPSMVVVRGAQSTEYEVLRGW